MSNDKFGGGGWGVFVAGTIRLTFAAMALGDFFRSLISSFYMVAWFDESCTGGVFTAHGVCLLHSLGQGWPVETRAAMSRVRRLFPRPGSETRSVTRPRGIFSGQSQRMGSGRMSASFMAPAMRAAWMMGSGNVDAAVPGAV